MPYTIYLSNGSNFVTIKDQVIDTTSSPLALVGEKTVNWGQTFSSNFVKLLENFSNTVPPNKPLIGQIWYDSSSQTTKSFNGTKWVSLGAFGETQDLQSGITIAGNHSTNNRISGTTGVILTNNNKSTAIGVLFGEGNIIAVSSTETITVDKLPDNIVVNNFNIAFKSNFTNGLHPGLTMADSYALYGVATANGSDGSVTQQIIDLQQQVNNNTSSITQEATTRTTADEAFSQLLTQLTTTVNDNTASISIESTTRSDAINALASQITQLTASVNDNINAAITQEATTRADAVSAVADQITQLTSTVNTNTASINQEITTRANTYSALSQQLNSLTATVGTNTAAIQSQQTASATVSQALIDTKNSLIASTGGGSKNWVQTTAPTEDDIYPLNTNRIKNCDFSSFGTDYINSTITIPNDNPIISIDTFNSETNLTPYGLNRYVATTNDILTTSDNIRIDFGGYYNVLPQFEYEFNCYTTSKNLTVFLTIEFYDANNTLLTTINSTNSAYGNGQNSNEKFGGTTLATDFKRLYIRTYPVTNAVYAKIAVIGAGQNSSQTSIVSIIEPFFGTIDPGLNAPVTWNSTKANQLWINLSDNNSIYIWNGVNAVGWEKTSDTRIDANIAAITQESTARTDQYNSLANQINSLTAANLSNEIFAEIATEQTVRATADSALSDQITALTTTVGSNTAAINLEVSTRSDAINALSQQLTTLTSTVNNIDQTTLQSQITNEATTRANADAAEASTRQTALATLASRPNGPRVFVQNTAPDPTQIYPIYSNYIKNSTFNEFGVSGLTYTETDGFGSASLSIFSDGIQAPSGVNHVGLYSAGNNIIATNQQSLVLTFDTGKGPIAANNVYEFSMWVEASGYTTKLGIYFYDSTGVLIGSHYNTDTVGSSNNGEILLGASNSVTDFINTTNNCEWSTLKRMWMVVQAPQYASSVKITLEAFGNGEIGNYISSLRPYFGRMNVQGPYVPSDWTNCGANPIWVNTADNNTVYIWNGLGSNGWQKQGDARIDTTIAAVTAETNARIAADTAEASARQSLSAIVAQNTSAINNEVTVRANQISALTQTVNYLSAINGSGDLTALVTNEATARADGDSALSQQISDVSTAFNSNILTLQSQLQNEATTRTTSDSAEVAARQAQIALLAARATGSSVFISSIAPTIDQIYPIGSNRIKNSTFTDLGTTGLIYSSDNGYTNPISTTLYPPGHSGGEAPAGTARFEAQLSGSDFTSVITTGQQALHINLDPGGGISANNTYEFSLYGEAYNCSSRLVMSFYDASNTLLSTFYSTDTVTGNLLGASGSIQNFINPTPCSWPQAKRVWMVVTAPTNSVSVVLQYVMVGNGQSNAFISLMHPYFGEFDPNNIINPSDWSVCNANPQWINTLDNNTLYVYNGVGGVGWEKKGDQRIDANIAAITNESTARVSADNALTSQINTLITSINNNTSAITTEATTRANADSALTNQLNTLTSTVNNNTSAITTEASTRSDAINSLSQQLNNLTTTVNNNTAAINTETTARTSSDSSLSTQLNTLSANMTAGSSDGNLIFNSEMFSNNAASTSGFAFLNASNISGAAMGINLSGWSAPGSPGINVIYSNIPGTTTNASVDIYTSMVIPASPGITYEASVYAAYHRATNCQLFLNFLNANGTYISTVGVATGGLLAGATNGLLSNFQRIGGFATSPDGTAFIQLFMRLYAASSNNSFGFFTRPFMRVAHPGQTLLSTYTPGPIDQSNYISAAVSTETTARVNGDNALAQQVTNLQTSLNGNTASLTSSWQSINGLNVRYGLQGYINGQTGGFVFTGALRNDGTAVYNMEFDSNVTINGNLLVNGTVSTPQIAQNAISNVYSWQGWTTNAQFNPVCDAGTELHISAISSAPMWYGSFGSFSQVNMYISVYVGGYAQYTVQTSGYIIPTGGVDPSSGTWSAGFLPAVPLAGSYTCPWNGTTYSVITYVTDTNGAWINTSLQLQLIILRR